MTQTVTKKTIPTVNWAPPKKKKMTSAERSQMMKDRWKDPAYRAKQALSWTVSRKIAASLAIKQDPVRMEHIAKVGRMQFGTNHTPEAKGKMSANSAHRVAVTINGVTYPSMRVAAARFGCHPATISKRCKSAQWKTWNIANG